MLAYRTMKSNKGSKIPGTDGLTIKVIEQRPERELVNEIQNRLQNYHPKVSDPFDRHTMPWQVTIFIDDVLKGKINQKEIVLKRDIDAIIYGTHSISLKREVR